MRWQSLALCNILGGANQPGVCSPWRLPSSLLPRRTEMLAELIVSLILLQRFVLILFWFRFYQLRNSFCLRCKEQALDVSVDSQGIWWLRGLEHRLRGTFPASPSQFLPARTGPPSPKFPCLLPIMSSDILSCHRSSERYLAQSHHFGEKLGMEHRSPWEELTPWQNGDFICVVHTLPADCIVSFILFQLDSCFFSNGKNH